MHASFRYSKGDYIYLTVNFILLLLIGVLVAYPLLYVISASFSSNVTTLGNLSLWPQNPSLEGYKAVLEYPRVWSGYYNSFLYMVLGTAINLVITICAAYPLSRQDLPAKNAIMAVFVFTMYFSGGMIPSYLLVRNLGMLNTMWAMVLPGALSVYNAIVMRTYFSSQIPEELREAADLDGCGTLRFLLRIVLPLSGPILAVIGLFYAVGHWNTYFSAMIYLSSYDRYPLQIILREILIYNQMQDLSLYDPRELYTLEQRANLMRYSLIIVSSLPVMLIYPLVQRHFVKGLMIGAIKG